ncbi:MAG TPA: CDP-glucose 4,6-dehydratase [Pyrinomonadaceae bacterium]|nr:CDP-glucose 4,6-dehydratase [Pyrinomonadaceae bacterium]
MNAKFWQGRRVFVTGHTGFKGSWLSLWLGRLGAHVTGYSLAEPTSVPALFDVARVSEVMTSSLAGDVRDLDALARAMSEARPEVVIHMAAQSLVRRSYTDPVGTYATNVLGTVNTLEAARRAEGVRAVLVVTSDKCYENREWVWAYREEDALGGHDAYSNSKACAELVTAAYRRSFFDAGAHAGQPAASSPGTAAVASARAGNVIGGGDWAEDRLLPDIFRAASEGREVRIRNPGAVRPWQHVLEPLSGYLLLAERLCGERRAEFAEGWNFGPREEDARTVAWVVERITEKWDGEGAPKWASDADAAHPHEARYLRLDCAKARERLHWRPRWTIEQALDATVEWYRAHDAGADARRLCAEQIDEYQRLVI